MNVSFVVITGGEDWDRVARVIRSSVRAVPEKNREILLIGTDDLGYFNHLYPKEYEAIRWIPFDESVKPGWITRKKNIGTQEASHDIVVYMHDYIELLPYWYSGLLEFGNDWDLCMNRILNIDNTRYRDWCVFFRSTRGARWTQKEPYQETPVTYNGSPYLLDYSHPGADFISGAYFLGKKQFMIKYPFDESLCWGNAEDCEHSARAIPNGRYVMNANSSVKLLKYKDVVFDGIYKD